MKKNIVYLLILTIFISLLPFRQGSAQTTEPIIKVKLINFLGNKNEITVKPNGDYITSDVNIVLHSGETYLLKIVDGKLALSKDGTLLALFESLAVKPDLLNSQLMINNRSYLGSFDFIIESGQFIRPINSVNMEDYLKGVVPIEMYPSWNLEALKTQAVAARTYAMSYINRGIINDTISYQVYGGYIWTPNTTKAVNETRGQVLHYNGRLIDAVYSASNGGMTESNANAWGNTAVGYLPIKNDEFDPKTIWSVTFNKTQIDLSNKDLGKFVEWWSTTKEIDSTISSNIRIWLNNNGYANREIKIISIPELSLYSPTSGSRVSKGSITIEFLVKDIMDQDGKLIPQRLSLLHVSPSKIRSMIGNRIMLSYLIDNMDNGTDVIRIQGRGDGHGVGMSQWGAKYRADAGNNYEEILKFYYSGVDIITLYAPSVKTNLSVSEEQETVLKNEPDALAPQVPVTIIPKQAITEPILQKSVTQALQKSVSQAPKKDKVAPVIKGVKATYNNSRKKVSLSYSINETSKVTVYVKNSKGTIIRYIEKQAPKKAGKYTVEWNVGSVTNGNYTFGIITADLAENKSSTVLIYKLNKPQKVATKKTVKK